MSTVLQNVITTQQCTGGGSGGAAWGAVFPLAFIGNGASVELLKKNNNKNTITVMLMDHDWSLRMQTPHRKLKLLTSLVTMVNIVFGFLKNHKQFFGFLAVESQVVDFLSVS